MGERPKPPIWPRHLLVWGAALALFFLGPYQVLQVLALDLESLVFNMVEGMPARVRGDELALDLARIQWGLTPLFVLLAARGLYALVARLRPTPCPLASGHLAARLLLVVPAAAGVVAFARPGAEALSVRYMAEAFYWIQWSANVQPAMAWVRAQTPSLVYPALAVTSCFVLWLSLRPGSPRKGPLPRVRRLILVSAGLLILLFWATAGGGQATVAALGGGQALFRERCGSCHPRARALYRVKPPGAWRRTITRMCLVEGAELDEAEAEEVITFLTNTRSFSDGWTFRTRCQRCHGLKTWSWEDRPPADWRRIVERLARWSPYFYRQPIREQIVAHLTRAASSAGATLGQTPAQYQAYQDLDRRCGVCHSLGWNADKFKGLDLARTEPMVRRMFNKNSSQLTDDQIKKLTLDYLTVATDPALFNRFFPHDLPTRTGGPRW